jgi:tight adherence protein B
MTKGLVLALVGALTILAGPVRAQEKTSLRIERVQHTEKMISLKVTTAPGKSLSESELEVTVNDQVATSTEITPQPQEGATATGTGEANAYRIEVSNPDPAALVYEVEIAAGPKGGGRAHKVTPYKTPASEGYSVALQGPPEGLLSPILLLVIFVTVALFVVTISEWLRRRRLSPRRRLRWYDEPAAPGREAEALINAAVLKRAKEIATRLADRSGHLERIELAIDAAGMRWRPGEVIVASAGLALAAGALLGSLGGVVWALLGAVVAGAAPSVYIRRAAATRKQAFYEQLSDVLLLMSGALKAGYSLQQAVATVGEDAKPPASEEFRRAMAEVRLGASLDDALEALARRSRMVDLEWSVLAIQIQREVGGNLAEILETIAGTIRERERLRRELRTLTAEGRLSGWVLGLLPFVIGAFLALRSPEYLEPLYQTGKGLMMVTVSVLLMIVGTLWMKRIVRIEE